MQLLNGLAILQKLRCQPVQQVRMSGPRTVPAKVIGRIDNSPAEMMMPDPIDDRSPREGVAVVGNPFGQLGSSPAFIFRIERSEIRIESGNTSQSTGLYRLD